MDSKGSNLIAEETNLALARDEFYTIWRPRDGPKKGFRTYVLKLKPAARKAAKIARLAGSLVLVCGGKFAETTVKDVLSLSGKEVADETLKAAGVKLRIGRTGVDVYGELAEIRYVVTGNRTAFVRGGRGRERKGRRGRRRGPQKRHQPPGSHAMGQGEDARQARPEGEAPPPGQGTESSLRPQGYSPAVGPGPFAPRRKQALPDRHRRGSPRQRIATLLPISIQCARADGRFRDRLVIH